MTDGEARAILSLTEERDKLLLQVGELRKALAQYEHVILPGGICPADILKKPFSDPEIKMRLERVKNGKCADCGCDAHLHLCPEIEAIEPARQIAHCRKCKRSTFVMVDECDTCKKEKRKCGHVFLACGICDYCGASRGLTPP